MKLTGSHSVPWILTTVYRSPQRITRHAFWDSIRSLRDDINLPWCLIRDFNAILHSHERKGGSPNQRHGACNEFQSVVSDCSLLDLGFTGWPYTWKRGNLVERIDRALCNLDWQLMFPEAKIRHLPMMKSDHSFLCLQLYTASAPNRRRRPFRFMAAWLTHSDFDNMLNNNWNFRDSWNNCVEDFKTVLNDWNRNIFENIQFRKNRIFRRLQGIVTSLSQNSNCFLENL
nr:uncharacterized protein LOC112757775 [Arachis hypogaea]